MFGVLKVPRLHPKRNKDRFTFKRLANHLHVVSHGLGLELKLSADYQLVD